MELRDALKKAGTSLETIALTAGAKGGDLQYIEQIRGYALNRAKVVLDCLHAAPNVTVEDIVNASSVDKDTLPKDYWIRKIWAKYASKMNDWPNDTVPELQDLGNGPRFLIGWQESEFQIFKAGFCAGFEAERVIV